LATRSACCSVSQVAAFFSATLYAAHERIHDGATRQAFIDDMLNAHTTYIGAGAHDGSTFTRKADAVEPTSCYSCAG